MEKHNFGELLFIVLSLIGILFVNEMSKLALSDFLFYLVLLVIFLIVGAVFIWKKYSRYEIENRERIQKVRLLPKSLINLSKESVLMGLDLDLRVPIYLPNSIRNKHVHIIGATGAGKTESVILNFLKQDIVNGCGAIILDAKGDESFLESLERIVPQGKLKVFDLSSCDSLTYDPIEVGAPEETAQRLFASLNWSEEYYKGKAFTALQKVFGKFNRDFSKNPSLKELANIFSSADTYISFLGKDRSKFSDNEYSDLSGLISQIEVLTLGYLESILSKNEKPRILLEDAQEGNILYFRLQSLLSPKLVSILGRLIINHINFLAGSTHRGGGQAKKKKFIPIYLDEFSSFACPEFSDLIAKARSAGFALHFSHQSIGDLMEVSNGFLGKITDNSATKIVLRVNDPDTAEFFAKSFGTRVFQKITQRITSAKNIQNREVLEEGTQREAHQFRAAPDLFKTLPTGVGAVLVAHGEEGPEGASSVFKIKFNRIF